MRVMLSRILTSATAKLHAAYLSLVLLLLASLVYALYAGIDTAVTLSYRDQNVYELEAVRKQLMATLPLVAEGIEKHHIVHAFERASNATASTKDGCVWVGWVGLKFSATGALEHVSPTWSYGEPDPCYPP